MSTTTSDQQLVIPVGPDGAWNPGAFIDYNAGVEGRLVLKYASNADRTARHPSPVAGDLSFVAGNTWYDTWTGSKWLPCTPISAVKTANQTINNTTITNDTQLFVPLPAANSNYAIDMYLRYSGTTTADFKGTFSVPAGATGSFGILGITTGAAGTTGDGQFNENPPGSIISIGGIGAATSLSAHVRGIVRTAGTTGNLQFQWAQDTVDAGNPTTLRDFSWLRVTALN